MTIAEQIASIRDLLPTTLGSAELRESLAADIRARLVFVSRASNAIFLSKVKEVVVQLAAGDMDHASARLVLREVLKAVGYTPEGGFPDVEEGEVPPALQGSLQDLSSTRRLDLILNTQVDLMRGRSMQLRGMEATALRMWPAWELVRAIQTAVPRDWPSRWVVAGGRLVDGGRMIALKGDPVWGELGSSGNFEDALDVDFPPFAFNSGMSWTPIERYEVERLGITGPEGETVSEWISNDRAVLTGTQSGIPAPKISIQDVPADIRRELESQGVSIIQDTATTPGAEDELIRRLAERAAARAARAQELLNESIAAREADYERRNPS